MVSCKPLIAALSVIAFHCQIASADTLEGRVVAVSDGDTIKILADRTEFKIRVAGIDAPEKGQPWGMKSKEGMSSCAYGKMASVEWSKRDRYGRIVGKVVIEGKDCGLAQLQHGLAWHFKQYEKEQTREDREEYARAENAARKSRDGLWADSEPVPPWQWRKNRKAGF